MRIHHLIIGVKDLAQTEVFYRQILGVSLVDAFLDTTTEREGLVMAYMNDRGEEGLHLRFVPFESKRLPSPQHLAIELSSAEFDRALAVARKYQLIVRAKPALDCKELGTSRIDYRGQVHEHFFLTDPNGVNLEILRRLEVN